MRKLNDDITTIDNEYNKRGELTKSTQVNGSTTTVYTYLISPYGNKSEVIDIYQDDILHTTTKAYVYNYLNQLESLTVGSIESEFEYDDYGNLILETNGSSTKSYSYDLNNRLIEAVEEGQTLQFTYDGNGNRLTKSIGSTVVQYVNDTTIENEQVLSYKVGSDVTNLSYGLTRLNEDAIGYLSDSYGNIVQHGSETYVYTPYGELTQGIINGVNEAGYKGEVHDTSSLQYLRARTYHTKLKQFLSEDTVVGKDTHPLSQNRYAFVLNNPFKYSDPSGHIALPYMMEDRGTSTLKPTLSTKANSNSKAVTTVPKTVVNNKLQQIYNDEVKLVQTSQQGSKSNTGSTTVSKNKVDTKLEQLYNEEIKQVNLSQSSSSNSTIKNTNTISTEPLHDDIGDIYKNYKSPISLDKEGIGTINGGVYNKYSFWNDKYGVYSSDLYKNINGSNLGLDNISNAHLEKYITGKAFVEGGSALLENELKNLGEIPGSVSYLLNEISSINIPQFPLIIGDQVIPQSIKSSVFGKLFKSISNSKFVKSSAFSPILGTTIGTLYDTVVEGESIKNAIVDNTVKTVVQIGLSQSLTVIASSIATVAFGAAALPVGAVVGVTIAAGLLADYIYESNFLGIKERTYDTVESIENYFSNRKNFEVDNVSFKNQQDLSFYSDRR